MLAGAGSGTAGAFVERFAKIEIGGPESRDRTEDKSGEDRNDRGEKQNSAVEADGKDLRDAVLGQAQERTKRGGRDEKTQRPAGERDEQAFGKQCANDAPSRGPHGSADGDFAAARGGAGKQQVGDVDASDEQNKADGAEQQQ